MILVIIISSLEIIKEGDYKGETAYLFDRKGKFMRPIGSKGGGPQDFTHLGYMWIDANSRYVVINTSGKALFFDLKGNFLFSTRFPIDDRQVSCYTQEKFLRVAESYLLRDSSYYVFNLFDQKGRLIKEAIRSVPIPLIADKAWRIAFKIIPIGNSYEYENMLHVRETMNDTIYQIDGLNNFIPKYVFNLGKYRLTPEIQGNLLSRSISLLLLRQSGRQNVCVQQQKRIS